MHLNVIWHERPWPVFPATSSLVSADEKKKLTDLIKQMNDTIAKHKAMDESAMKSMDEKMGSQPMAPGHHDKH